LYIPLILLSPRQTDPCGIQLFHLLSHTHGTGGATLLVDGFRAAAHMRAAHPAAHALLARVPVPAHAAGEPHALYRPHPPAGFPVLAHDARGVLAQVRWNGDDRSVMRALEPALVEPWCVARAFCLLARSLSSWLSLSGQVRRDPDVEPIHHRARGRVLGAAPAGHRRRQVASRSRSSSATDY
jgi:hypothetical protein